MYNVRMILVVHLFFVFRTNTSWDFLELPSSQRKTWILRKARMTMHIFVVGYTTYPLSGKILCLLLLSFLDKLL